MKIEWYILGASTYLQVYVTGHIPPGYFELVDDVYWLYPEYSRRFVSIVNSYSDVITGQFFGHHHTDSYRMLYDENNAAVSNVYNFTGFLKKATFVSKHSYKNSAV